MASNFVFVLRIKVPYIKAIALTRSSSDRRVAYVRRGRKYQDGKAIVNQCAQPPTFHLRSIISDMVRRIDHHSILRNKQMYIIDN